MLLRWWSAGAVLPCEEHLDITVSFSLKTDSEWGLLCQFKQPTVIEAITVGFKTKTDTEGPCRHCSLLVKKYKKNHHWFGAYHHNTITAGFKTKTGSEGPCRHRSLLVKNIKKSLSFWSLPSQPFYKKYKKTLSLGLKPRS